MLFLVLIALLFVIAVCGVGVVLVGILGVTSWAAVFAVGLVFVGVPIRLIFGKKKDKKVKEDKA